MQKLLIVLFLCFFFYNFGLKSQNMLIRNVDETNFPSIKLVLEFPGAKAVDFNQVKLIENGTNLVYSIDSISDSESNKSICILVERSLLQKEQHINEILNTIKEISNLLTTDDRINIVLTRERKDSKQCIEPLSFEFTNDYGGLYYFLASEFFQKPATDKSLVNSCALEQTLEFILSKKNLPLKKLLIILTSENLKNDSLTGIQRKANEAMISIYRMDPAKDKKNKQPNIAASPDLMNELFDSVFTDRFHTTYTAKKLYVLQFFTRQNNELNQFEIEYKETKLRSTFAKPGYMNFFKENSLLIGVIAFFLLLIIFFIVNLIYTKRQLMISVRELKSHKIKPIVNNEIGIESFRPTKTYYGTNAVTPFLSVEIDGKKTDYDLNKLITTIGRNPENDIVIDNLTISGNHAEIHIDGGQIYIQDNGSTNGTIVNDNKISKVVIKNGDIIRLGKARIILTC